MRVLLILGNHKSLTHKVSLRLSCTHQTYLKKYPVPSAVNQCPLF